MELIFSSFVLTFLLLVGAFIEFLITGCRPYRVSHRDAFRSEPKRAPVVQITPEMEPEYDQAA